MLLDIRLRDGDGLDLLRELRQGPRRDVPVVMVTAYGDSERTISAMRDGAFDYLTKPFDVPVLLSTVARALKQRTLAQNLSSETPAVPPPLESGTYRYEHRDAGHLEADRPRRRDAGPGADHRRDGHRQRARGAPSTNTAKPQRSRLSPSTSPLCPAR